MRISILLLLVLGVFACQKPGAQVSNRKMILISFDGFRHDYFDRVDTPNFDILIEGGTTAGGLIPVFPTKTFSNHYSIVTGLYPENTGIISNTMFDRGMDKFYRISDREAVENPDWYAGEPIWNTAEQQGLVAGTLFWVGSEAPVGGRQATYWKVYDNDFPDAARIDTLIHWFTRTDAPQIDFGTLYFSFVDSRGHSYGVAHDTISHAIREADALVGHLINRLKDTGLWGNTDIVIVSDHGMAELSEDRVILIDQIIDVSRVQMVDWTPVSMINFPDADYLDEAYEKLKQAEKDLGHIKVYKKADIPERWRIKNHDRTTDIIVVADNGYTITSRNRLNFFVQGLPSGTHGYDNLEKDMEGIFLAYGPSFKQGLKIPPFENVHIYEMLCKVLGIKPATNDGDPRVLKSILRE